MISHENGIFEFTLEQNPELVGVVRRSAVEFVSRVIDDLGTKARLEVAIHELLENGVKYAANGKVDFRLQITRTPRRRVTISTRNKALREDISWVRREVDILALNPDKDQYYQEAMMSSVQRGGRARLGLSRIASESGMEIRCRTHGDGDLEVIADASL